MTEGNKTCKAVMSIFGCTSLFGDTATPCNCEAAHARRACICPYRLCVSFEERLIGCVSPDKLNSCSIAGFEPSQSYPAVTHLTHSNSVSRLVPLELLSNAILFSSGDLRASCCQPHPELSQREVVHRFKQKLGDCAVHSRRA
jgi:hypothetical protein